MQIHRHTFTCIHTYDLEDKHDHLAVSENTMFVDF